MSANHHLSPLIRAIAGTLMAAACLAPATASAAAPPSTRSLPSRVGQIFIVGNSRTLQSIILEQVELYPGQVLTYPDLKRAEKNLARLGIFENSAKTGVHPTVTALDNQPDRDNPYKDILISVKEANTGSLMFGMGLSPSGRPSAAIIFEERNCDILRLPMSLEDVRSGGMFRGAGQVFRLEILPTELCARITCSGVSLLDVVRLPLGPIPGLLYGYAVRCKECLGVSHQAKRSAEEE
jgi:hypothetical protein